MRVVFVDVPSPRRTHGPLRQQFRDGDVARVPIVRDDERCIRQFEQRLRLVVPETRVQRDEDGPDVGGGEEQRHRVNRVVAPPDDPIAPPDPPLGEQRRQMVGAAGDLGIGQLPTVVGDGDHARCACRGRIDNLTNQQPLHRLVLQLDGDLPVALLADVAGRLDAALFDPEVLSWADVHFDVLVVEAG